MAVPVGDATDKGGDDHLRPLAADSEDGVEEHAVVSPAGKGLLHGF